MAASTFASDTPCAASLCTMRARTTCESNPTPPGKILCDDFLILLFSSSHTVRAKVATDLTADGTPISGFRRTGNAGRPPAEGALAVALKGGLRGDFMRRISVGLRQLRGSLCPVGQPLVIGQIHVKRCDGHKPLAG